MSRYHRIDGWRGYSIPEYAVAGSSDTGTAPDSPANSDAVGAELERFRDEVLRPAGIRSRLRWGGSSNVFCGKRWITVAREDFAAAAQLTVTWLRDHRDDTRFIHDADLDVLGFRPSPGDNK